MVPFEWEGHSFGSMLSNLAKGYQLVLPSFSPTSIKCFSDLSLTPPATAYKRKGKKLNE